MTSAPAKQTPERGATWTIAQIAEEFGVTHRTVRHYEDLGLISPERRGTQRVYHRRDRTRLALILRGKRLGFPLEEIRTIIDLFDAPRGRRTQLEYVLGQIDDRRADLLARLADLQAALGELDAFEARCREDLEHIEGSGDGQHVSTSLRSTSSIVAGHPEDVAAQGLLVEGRDRSLSPVDLGLNDPSLDVDARLIERHPK